MSDATPLEPRHTEAGDAEPGLRVLFPPGDSSRPARARQNLVRLLVGKSIFEALLVAALVVAFLSSAFNPSFRGALTLVGHGRIEGWVIDTSRPEARVEVQLYVDGRFVASTDADKQPPEMSGAGMTTDGRHGFRFDFDVEGSSEHEARVYAVHTSGDEGTRTLQLVGKPLRFGGGSSPEVITEGAWRGADSR